jgi:hypothetical protein
MPLTLTYSSRVRYSFGFAGGAEEDESEETADAAGVVPEGAVADSIVVGGGWTCLVERPNILARRSVTIPITKHPTLCGKKLRTASRRSQNRTELGGVGSLQL